MKSKGRVAGCRAILYSFFAQALSSPSDALVRGICDGSLGLTVAAAFDGAPLPHRRMIDASQTVALASRDSERATRDRLLVEYTRLYGAALMCPHYEADHVGGDPFRAVHIISEIAAFYATFGVRVAAGACERPDYIGIELDFMKFLTATQSLAVVQKQWQHSRICRAAQEKFFREHLGQWASGFASGLIEATSDRFYEAVGQLLLQFVAAERTYLRLVQAEFAYPGVGRPTDPTYEMEVRS